MGCLVADSESLTVSHHQLQNREEDTLMWCHSGDLDVVGMSLKKFGASVLCRLESGLDDRWVTEVVGMHVSVNL